MPRQRVQQVKFDGRQLDGLAILRDLARVGVNAQTAKDECRILCADVRPRRKMTFTRATSSWTDDLVR
jgi:hypothetical protein